MEHENIPKMFYKEIRDKKVAGRGIRNRASRKGYIRGGIKTASDYLTAKEKKGLSGEVIMYNKYDKFENLPSLSELKTKTIGTIRYVLTKHLQKKQIEWTAQCRCSPGSFSKLQKLVDCKPAQENFNGIEVVDMCRPWDTIKFMKEDDLKIVLEVLEALFTRKAISKGLGVVSSTIGTRARSLGIRQLMPYQAIPLYRANIHLFKKAPISLNHEGSDEVLLNDIGKPESLKQAMEIENVNVEAIKASEEKPEVQAPEEKETSELDKAIHELQQQGSSYTFEPSVTPSVTYIPNTPFIEEEEASDEFSLSLNAPNLTYKKVVKRLEKLIGMLDEDCKYDISIKIKEREDC